MDTKHISISDYNYELPDERIAKFPVSPRDHSKLLVYDHGHISDDYFYEIATHLPQGALMVFNNTKVIQARLYFRKQTGALIEVFLLEPYIPADYEQMFLTRGRCTWQCMVGNLKKWKEGTLLRELSIGDTLIQLKATRKPQPVEVEEGSGSTSHLVIFEWDNADITFADILDTAGQLPIPPYLNRPTHGRHLRTHQTDYLKIKVTVAAPTAALHFTPHVLQSLDEHGIDREELTLHVGAGTFKPVKSSYMEGHEMHTEHICVHRQTLHKLLKHQCRAIAVGTTSVRTLESLYYMGLKVLADPQLTEHQLHVAQWEPYELPNSEQPVSRQQVIDAITALLHWLDDHQLSSLHASTQIIIAPGYQFKIVSHLITNFHQPQSTLLLLVSAFTQGHWREIYSHALSHDYRFLSYGDSSVLTV